MPRQHGNPLVTAVIKNPDDAVRLLNRLQPALQLMKQSVDFGPVPGAWIPFTFTVAGVSAAANQVGQVTPVEFHPVALSVWCDTGTATVDINANGSSILTTPFTTTAGCLTNRGSFATETVARGSVLTLDVDAVDGGPTKLRVVLWASNLGRLIDSSDVDGVGLTANAGTFNMTGQVPTVTTT